MLMYPGSQVPNHMQSTSLTVVGLRVSFLKYQMYRHFYSNGIISLQFPAISTVSILFLIRLCDPCVADSPL